MVGPQQDALAWQSAVTSPFLVDTSVPSGQTSHAASVSQIYGLQHGLPSHSGTPFDAGVDAKCDDAQSNQPNVMVAHASPKTYPDTKLYQFADIELAHEH